MLVPVTSEVPAEPAPIIRVPVTAQQAPQKPESELADES